MTGDEEQKAEERVGEHDVEMQGGNEEEIIEMVRNDDEQDEQEDHEKGRRKVTKLHDPKLPSEMEVKENYCSGTCRTGAGVTIVYADADESVTTNEREIKKDWGFPSTTWTIASLAMSSTG